MGRPSETLTPPSKVDELHGNVALVVIHGHDEIELAAQGANEDGVGRVRAGAVDAERARFFNGGSDDVGILRAEEAVLAGVRIEAADGDARRAAAHPAGAHRCRAGWCERCARGRAGRPARAECAC